MTAGTAVYGTVRTVVWEDGGRKPSSYPMDYYFNQIVDLLERHIYYWKSFQFSTLSEQYILSRIVIYMFDIAIKGGLVIDGSGFPGRTQDIGIRGDTIAECGIIEETQAQEVVDARGSVVCPGFIDIHAHSDFNLLVEPPGKGKIMQGVTTEVCGNCGLSAAPLMGKAREQRQKSLSGFGVNITWSTLKEYADILSAKRLFCNVVPLIGHGNIRGSVVGYDNRPPSPDEMNRMINLLEESMETGAWGLSSGLIYPPGTYATVDELIALAKIAARYGGIYTSHIRSEGDRVEEAVTEAITIGERSGIPVQISHLKTIGKKNWGKLPRVFRIIEEAIDRGLAVSADRYPYTAASTDLDALLPPWACEGGNEAEIKRLHMRADREKIFLYIIDGEEPEEVFNGIVIARVYNRQNKPLEGKTIVQAAGIRNQTVKDTFFDLLIEEELRVGALFFTMNEENLRKIYQKDYVMVGSDSSVWDVDGPLGDGKPHPRGFGTFPRVFRKYVFEEKMLSLEQVIKKMTGQPAAKLGLKDRGLIKRGYRADLLMLKKEDLEDRATYENPHQFPGGIVRVMVNGRWVVAEGKVTGTYPGRVLLKNKS
ncbi:MAG: D-aminoacylase [Proteobacteria bacterium]|nr:D-aminoacylase [Pseudomonadota bacterium]